MISLPLQWTVQGEALTVICFLFPVEIFPNVFEELFYLKGRICPDLPFKVQSQRQVFLPSLVLR